VRAGGYGLILLAFPVIGLVMGLAGGASAGGDPATPPGPPPGGGGPPGHPAPDPPGGIRLAAAGADGLAASLPGFAEDRPCRADVAAAG
jgi:hypothetical protein